MGRNRSKNTTLQDLIDRPWCYYCEKDFDDLGVLIDHQRAKHFKCPNCSRRLQSAGGLRVHLSQVHKENLSYIENALDGHEGVEVEIIGMLGIPEENVERHRQSILEGWFQKEVEHRMRTGNPLPGSGEKQAQTDRTEPLTSILERAKARKAEWQQEKQVFSAEEMSVLMKQREEEAIKDEAEHIAAKKAKKDEKRRMDRMKIEA